MKDHEKFKETFNKTIDKRIKERLNNQTEEPEIERINVIVYSSTQEGKIEIKNFKFLKFYQNYF